MGRRGPKAVNVDHLKAEATAWASLFYALRDGQSGQIQRVKWGPWRNTGIAKRKVLQSGRLVDVPAKTRYRTFKRLGPAILIPWAEAARKLPPKTEAKDLVIFRPVMPEPEIWELLKQARSVMEIREASQRIRKWMTRQLGQGVGRWLPGYPPVELSDTLDQCADKLLVGKTLPTYAKTDRPTSDDKRVEFLSKVLAGARHGLAPITAAKRLSHWHFPSDWAEKSLKQFIERSQKEFAERGIATKE